MAKKQMMWKTKGMNQDMSVSAFSPEFTFENMNLRLSTNEGNTLMSWVNERGTEKLNIVTGKWNPNDQTDTTVTGITGTPIGTAVLNNQLVLFTTETIKGVTPNNNNKPDHIYVLKYKDSSKQEMLGRELFNDNLKLDTDHPLETLVSYESEAVQKIYWVDGKNQPRVINIADEKVSTRPNTYFDFVPTLKLDETITVQKMLGANGTFAPGVIQYAFTYYNKYGQESNIFYTTPLYYISYLDRGASPEDKVDNAFKITIEGIDRNFDYLRIYSIQRTSINGTPFCKRIQDIEIASLKDANNNPITTASYTDTGTSGDTVDPTELLYKGGEVVIPSTIEQKDGTLFLGNFKTDRDSLKELEATITSDLSIETPQSYTRTIYPTLVSSGDYQYANQLTSYKQHLDSNNQQVNDITVPCGGFKKGDYYRCGVQFQHESGKWSDPIFKEDFKVTASPNYNPTTNALTLPVIKGTFKPGDEIISRGYKKIRPVVVFPEMKDRVTLCQGVVNPTLYTRNHRNDGEKNNDLYAQASWFFRCPTNDYGTDDDGVDINFAPFFKENSGNNYILPYTSNVTENPQNPGDPSVYDPITNVIRRVEIEGQFGDNNKFIVDTNTLTLHSPEIEFDGQFSTLDFNGKSGIKIGEVTFDHTLSDIEIQTESPTISNDGLGFVHKSFSKGNSWGIVSGLFYDDYIVDDRNDEEHTLCTYERQRVAAKWLIYPWQGSGSLNNDINRPADKGTATAVLKKKVISNLRYATTSHDYPLDADFISGTPQLFSSEECTITKINNNIYQGNIDTLLNPDDTDGKYFCLDTDRVEIPPSSNKFWYFGTNTAFNSNNWKKLWSKKTTDSDQEGIRSWNGSSWEWWDSNIGDDYVDLVRKKLSVRMKYKSTPHIVLSVKNGIDLFKTDTPNKMLDYNQLPLVELRNSNSNRFGGTSPDALKENRWIPCGEPVRLDDLINIGTEQDPVYAVEFEYSYGDIYFQRWDCLKTYAFTPEDINQVVEIGSFMLETHVNIDGRYDRNRGQINNLNMSPRNFNLLNPVYSQQDNFFTYRIQDDSYYANTQYPNQITWSKTKASDADVDQWTNMTLASVLELDGDKGAVSKLIRLNDQLLCFQDTGISQILYNENVQIASTAGVPIEIANSEKVQGKRYLSNTIGCSNKWSMTTTPNGIYFMDSTDKSIYLFNGQLQNLSAALGFNSWCKQNISSKDLWNPTDFKGFVTYFDKSNQDVLWINSEIALAYSERLGAFTSFYNYGRVPYFCNLEDTGVWISKKKDLVTQNTPYSIWKHQGSNKYCNFFDKEYPYWMTLVGNPEPTLDKIFTNLEFRACVDNEGYLVDANRFIFTLPFDSLETWNEYQHGFTALSPKNGHSMFKHGGSDSSLIRKFRIWRCDIPRDNYSSNVENSFDSSFDYTFHGGGRKTHPTDRMRNPWVYLKLKKNVSENESISNRTEIHDIMMTYFC